MNILQPATGKKTPSKSYTKNTQIKLLAFMTKNSYPLMDNILSLLNITLVQTLLENLLVIVLVECYDNCYD